MVVFHFLEAFKDSSDLATNFNPTNSCCHLERKVFLWHEGEEGRLQLLLVKSIRRPCLKAIYVISFWLGLV